MTDATSTLFGIAILVISVVVHEVSHGIAAYMQGDKTAKYAGRLTLNPLPHIDPFGSIFLPFILVFLQSPFLIGWAKPVPYNPYNLRNQKWGPAIVGAAGPLSNLTIAVIFGVVLRLGARGMLGGLPPEFLQGFLSISITIVIINIALAVFNLMPIAPLDGSKVLFALLPYRLYWIQQFLEMWGFMLLIFFIMFLSPIVSVLTRFLFHIITGIPS